MAISKVLICDDSTTDRVNIRNILVDAGCVVVESRNGKEAVAMARSEKPDIIFLDILMPEMNGYEACRALSAHPETKHIPVIFVSSKRQKADRVWAQMQGGRDLVAKPYTRDDIVQQLTR